MSLDVQDGATAIQNSLIAFIKAEAGIVMPLKTLQTSSSRGYINPLKFLRIKKKYEVQLNIYAKVHFMSLDIQKFAKIAKT